MTNELTPVRCGCGGEAVVYVTHWWGKCYVCECDECGIQTKTYPIEAEAITAWNRAMSGNVHECAKDARCSERTAKVVEGQKGSWYCDGCGKWCDKGEDIYCAHCGAKLDWSE